MRRAARDSRACSGAFGLSAYTDFYSEQSDAVRVFVDDASTLRLAKTGRMQYTTTGDQSTVTAYESGEVTGAAAIDAQIDCARTLLDTVHRAAQTDTHASLYAVPEGRQPHDARVFAALRRRSRARKHGFRVVHL